jgi:hypothetical protein
MIATIIASIGFTFAVTSFIAGFRMIRIADKRAEVMLHKVNGYITITTYIVIAIISLTMSASYLYFLLWLFGFSIHLFKVFLARKKLAVRYGGYVGSMILMSWIIIIFNHLPG